MVYDPRPASDRGLKVTLRQSMGAQASGGADALLGYRTLEGLGAGDDEPAQRRLEAWIGYGIPAFGGRFTATPEIGMGVSETSREYRAGWRLGLGTSRTESVELTFGATRSESAGSEAPEHGVALGLTAQW